MNDPTNVAVKVGTKHSEIFRVLHDDIVSGKYAPGSRIPTEAEIAERFDVSRPTVSQALRHLQAKGMIARRPGSGTYVLKTEAKPNVQRQFCMLGPGMPMTGIFEIMCAELANMARAKNYFLHWGSADYPASDQDLTVAHAVELCDQFIRQKVDGVFFAPFELTDHSGEQSEAITRRFVQAKIPVVLLDRDLTPFPNRSNFDLVTVDNVEGGFLLGEHLASLGCRRIAFIQRPNSAQSVMARAAGVREALAGRDIETKGWIKTGDPEDLAFAEGIVKEGWDGIVCANDMTAARLLRSFEKINVSVPRDIRLVGFDDAKFATLLGVQLTTIRQPCREMAIAAFHALMGRVVTPSLPARSITLSPTLVVRESCGAQRQVI